MPGIRVYVNCFAEVVPPILYDTVLYADNDTSSTTSVFQASVRCRIQIMK